MSLLGRFFPPPSLRIAALDTGHAARLAAIHADGFRRPWSTLEFERLLAERNVMADGLFLGQAPAPMGFVMSRAVIDEAEILTVALAAEARGRGYARPLLHGASRRLVAGRDRPRASRGRGRQCSGAGALPPSRIW